MANDTHADWRELAPDPDPETDLGYDLDEWEVVEARSGGRDHLMFLPSDEEQLREDAFIVAEPSLVQDVGENC